jgi:L-lactate dehydrogenase complex protein LldF
MKKEYDYTNDSFLDNALKRLRENYFSKRQKVEKLYDIESLKEKVKDIKEHSITNLDENLSSFIDILKKRNINVSLAKDKKEAVDIITSILKKNKAEVIVKSKSLTTEEIELNSFLDEHNFEVVETDLGEWLVQINHEPPTHMTAPAIHMPKEKINELLNKTFNTNLPVEPKTMVDFSKNKIKEHFSNAQCGIIGSNVLSLESGSFFIVSNEGNIQNVIRQKTVICVVGIDKIVETDKEAFDILELLPKAATGQITTSYIDILKKPFGKFYVVFIDNGRRKVKKDENFREILNCIRCGACQNACPVYTTVGGEFFRGKTYAGPIGVLLSYLINDTPDIKRYTELCTGCMACDEICSSKIGLQHLIMTIKSKYTESTPGIKGLIIKHIENRYELLRIGTYLSHFLFRKELKTHIKRIDRYLGNDFRPLPGIKKSFDIIKTESSSMGLFAGCSTNFLYTNLGKDALSVAKKLGISLQVIKQKSCCGAPALYNGEDRSAREAAEINIDYLTSLNFERILFLDPHCAHMIKRDYTLLTHNPKAKELSEKVVCAGAFFIDLIEKKSIKTERLGSLIGYHHPCHLNRGLHYSQKLHNFIEENEPNFIEIKDADRCCGFAGTYSIMHPYISKKLLENKVNSVTDAHLQTLITACPGCMMQIGGGFKVKHLNIELLHFVSYLDKIL